MKRFLAQTALLLLANAVALVVAAMFLPGFSLNARGFVVAVCIFTASTVILEPLISKFARQSAPYLLGGIALVTTFVGLLLTTLLTSGLSITSVGTWVVATLIIWIATVVASLVLPRLLFKEVLSDKGKAKE
jgi:putative membrane protein